MTKELGIAIGLTEHGYNPQDLAYIEGSNAVWDREGGPSGRLLIKAAHDLLVATGRGRTAPAWHLHFLTKMSDWDAHSKEVAEHIGQVMEVLEPMRKQAFNVSDAIGAGGTVGRAALLTSLAAGGGLGSLYWLLSRHSNQDSSDIESMQNQVNYYNELSKEVEDSMRRKYRYERNDEQSPGTAAPGGAITTGNSAPAT